MSFLGGRLFNRDLSWLSFNDRVLNEASDPSVPPLERLRFASIVSSNLDEFFMIRVAEISRLSRMHPFSRFPDGTTARQILPQIRERVLKQKTQQATILEDILSTLSKNGIIIQTHFEKNFLLDAEIRKHLPTMRYIIRKSSEPPPPLPGSGIHIFVRFPKEYAIVRIEDREARMLHLGRTGRLMKFALFERWFCSHAKDFFSGREIVEAFPFKILRDADLRYRPDDEETLEDQIVDAVERRGRAGIVRLEVDSPSYSEGALFLATTLGVNSAALYRFDLPLDLRTLALVSTIPASRELRFPPIRPVLPPALHHPKNIFERIRTRDILLHHPYDSFEPVVRFIEQASRDPNVEHIYHSIYRMDKGSPIPEALKEAARRGKTVAVYVEIKARFEELNNVRLAAEFRQAGVRVVRPLGGFKVHSKMTLVLRREGSEAVPYLHLGTGNYHSGTARQYTDLGILTTNPDLGREILAYFEMLARGKRPPAFKHLLVAPNNLHAQVLRLIREETRIQRSGGRGHIVAKMNALADPDIINALYEASSAGVRVDLMVRGTCCLIPRLAGLSENIRVISVIDRFLEHSRIYYFRSGGEKKVYLSSADWRPRNFYRRYEIAFPVTDPALKRFILEVVLANSLSDNTKAWELHSDGHYSQVTRTPGAPKVHSQFVFESLARKNYKGTILEKREDKKQKTG
jgi:polyphosphate kinase